MKTSVFIILFGLCMNSAFSQCNQKVDVDIPEGYEFLKRLDISMEKSSDTLTEFSFVLKDHFQYRLMFVEDEQYQKIASYELYENDQILATNFIKAKNKFFPYYDFKCSKEGTYHLKVKKQVDKKYCGHCFLVVKNSILKNEQNADTEINKNDPVFVVVEEMPVFNDNDDMVAFRRYIASSLIYPDEALKQKIVGKVYVQFIVDEKGDVQNVNVIRGAHPILDAEAFRVVSSSPKWEKPGYQKGKAVKVQYTLPITFNFQ